MKKEGIRVEVDNRSEKIGAKIRDAELQKINIMLIVGEKEVDDKLVTVRRRFIKEQQTISLKEFSSEIKKESTLFDKRVDRLIINRKVEDELISYLKIIKTNKLNNTRDSRYGPGVCSDFNLFADTSPTAVQIDLFKP